MTDLERENILVLQLVQALIGSISAGMRAISIQIQEEHVTVHFAVRETTSELQEEVDDIICELDALIPGSMTSEAVVHVGKPDLNWVGRNYRRVYQEKPSTLN